MNIMKRKTILALITVCILSFASCGKQETTATTESVPATVESVQAETTVTEETVTTETEATTEETEPTDSLTDEGTVEATNSEGLTVEEAETADVEYMDKLVESGNYEGDIFTQYDAYVKDQGADAYDGAWLIYYYGSAAGDQRSYAINQRTGEKIVAGPDSYFYGTSLDDDGASPFYGTDKTYPGDTFPEFEENMTLAIEGKPAHTNGQ